MNKAFKLITIILTSVLMSGCATSYVMKESKKNIALRQASRNNDEKAIKAIKEYGLAGIGVDITALQAIKEQPLMQLGAALVDAGMFYGLYRGAESLDLIGDKNGNNVNITGQDNIVNIITGDANSTSQDDTTETTTEDN